MTESVYPALQSVAATVEAHFNRHITTARPADFPCCTALPDAATIEALIDVAFWASLRREEGYFPKISFAFLPPEQVEHPLLFAERMALKPLALARLAPAVERPSIHLGVWRYDGELYVWGTAHAIPSLCFVLEVIEPGLLVVKYRRTPESGKFVNVVVLKGSEVKVVAEEGSRLPDCPSLVASLLGLGTHPTTKDATSVLVQLAVSMRTHGRGGTLLVVPQDSDTWRESILRPVLYAVSPPYAELAHLMRREASAQRGSQWQDALRQAIELIAGLTAVDGAAIMTNQYELLAFGSKIGTRNHSEQVEQVITTQPVVGIEPLIVNPLQLGGTRHLSAAQFVQDQHDAIALVASQDGRFTVFAWSPCENMVHAHRIETLLL